MNRTFEVKSIADAQIIASFETGSSVAGRIAIADANTTADNSVGIGSTGDNLNLYAGAAAKATLSSAGNLSVTGNLTSLGIDDNATSTAITIDASENVGIGVTDPDATLEVYMPDSATGPYFHGGGSRGLRIADSTITNAGDRTEFYKPTSSGMFSFKNSLKELLTIKSSGRIGSDETNPQDRIHIKGSLPALRLENTAGAADSYTRIAGIDGALRIQADQGDSTANSFIAFDVDTVERMRVDSSGSVSITGAVTATSAVLEGTSDSILTLRSTDDGPLYMEFERGTDRHAYLGFGGSNDVFKINNEESAGEIEFLTANTSAVTIDASQNTTFSGSVSVGNTGSGVKLYPSGTTNEGAQIDLDTAGSHTGSHSIDVYAERLRFLNSTASGAQQFYTAGNTAVGGEQAADGEWQFHKGVRIDGQDSNSGVNLHISDVNPEIRFTETDRTGAGKNYWFHQNNGIFYLLKDRTVEGSWSSPHPQRFYPDDTIDWYDKMKLTATGDLHVDGNVTAYSTSVSDERFKDDVQPITGALDTVDALQGVTYTWNAGSREGKRDYGLIAQDVEKVLPELVHESTMPLMTGGDNDTLYKTLDYDKLVSVLVQAVSELRAEVEALKNGSSD